MNEPEIWFERIGPSEPFASYMPIHWKGWVVLATQISIALAFILPVASWSERHPSSYGETIILGLFALFFVWMMRTGYRHSAPRPGEKGSVG